MRSELCVCSTTCVNSCANTCILIGMPHPEYSPPQTTSSPTVYANASTARADSAATESVWSLTRSKLRPNCLSITVLIPGSNARPGDRRASPTIGGADRKDEFLSASFAPRRAAWLAPNADRHSGPRTLKRCSIRRPRVRSKLMEGRGTGADILSGFLCNPFRIGLWMGDLYRTELSIWPIWR